MPCQQESNQTLMAPGARVPLQRPATKLKYLAFPFKGQPRINCLPYTGVWLAHKPCRRVKENADAVLVIVLRHRCALLHQLHAVARGSRQRIVHRLRSSRSVKPMLTGNHALTESCSGYIHMQPFHPSVP